MCMDQVISQTNNCAPLAVKVWFNSSKCSFFMCQKVQNGGGEGGGLNEDVIIELVAAGFALYQGGIGWHSAINGKEPRQPYL